MAVFYGNQIAGAVTLTGTDVTVPFVIREDGSFTLNDITSPAAFHYFCASDLTPAAAETLAGMDAVGIVHMTPDTVPPQ